MSLVKCISTNLLYQTMYIAEIYPQMQTYKGINHYCIDITNDYKINFMVLL